MKAQLSFAVLAIAAIGFMMAQTPKRQAGPTTATALLVSDVHFNPVADPTLTAQLIAAPVDKWEAIFQSSAQKGLSTYGSDSNYALMKSAFVATAGPGPYRYVVFTGDMLCHELRKKFLGAGGTSAQYPDFAIKTSIFVVNQMQKSFGAPVFLALGNNDSTTGDYSMAPKNAYFAALSKVVGTVASNPAAASSFQLGGYYTVPNPAVPDQDIIVLNTVLWSTSYKDPGGGDPRKPGQLEFVWLEAQLKNGKSKGRKASLVMHIPPGMDVFNSLKNHTASNTWRSDFAQAFRDLSAKYSGVLSTSFFGHTHMDEFRVMPDAGGKPSLALRGNPAVSPYFDNNPGFGVLTFDTASGVANDIVTYNISLASSKPIWGQEYRFSTTYGTAQYTAPNLSTLTNTIRQKGLAYNAYVKLYDVSASPSPIDSSNWAYYSCTQSEFTETGYNNCVAKLGGKRTRIRPNIGKGH